MAVTKTVEDAIASVKKIMPGEVVVVEYTSLAPVHLAVSVPLLSLGRDVHVIVNDIFDQLHVVRSHLSIMGIDTEWMDEMPVVKFGGVLQTGRVIKRISVLKAASVWHEEYKEALREFRGQKLVVTLGLEKLINIKKELPASTVCRMCIASAMGEEDTITIAFVNRDMLPESVLEDIRELASRVLELEFEKGKLSLRVVKSLDLRNTGAEFSVDASELVRHLSNMGKG